jgi:hypothetical protein
VQFVCIAPLAVQKQNKTKQNKTKQANKQLFRINKV